MGTIITILIKIMIIQQHQLKKLNIELRQKYYEKWAINEDALAEYAQALATR